MKRHLVAFAVALLCSIAAFASDDPVKDTRTILAGTVTTASTKKAYLSGARDTTAAFKGALAAYKGVRAAEVPAPAPMPRPAPPAPASSADNPMTGQAPGVGAREIATLDHDVMDDLTPAWGSGAIPGSNKPDVVGAFRFICRHSSLLFDDPTVYPNQPGASHLHDQTGVYGWNAFSNYGNLRVSGGGSSCNDVAGHDRDASKINYAANRTPYWQPALLDGKGNVILADYTSFYYKQRPASDPLVSDPANPQYTGRWVGLPNGIKFIFGADPVAKTPTDFHYDCIAASGAQIMPDTTFAKAVQCAKDHFAEGGQLKVGQTGPGCWDGIHLDVPDHRSHLAYGSYGSWGYYKCDAAHPYVIIAFTYAAAYSIAPTDDGDIRFASDDMDPTQPRGWSFHVDYGPADWDNTVLRMWIDNCINKLLNCSGGDLGNGLQLKGAAQPIYLIDGVYTAAWRNPKRLVPVPPRAVTPMAH